MSIDIQADLQNVEQAREIDEEYLRHERQSASAGGARYRNPINTEADDAGEDLDTTHGKCQNCGHSVSSELARLEGDNNHIVWHCFHCVTQTAMKKGAGADPNFERRSENTGTIGGGL